MEINAKTKQLDAAGEKVLNEEGKPVEIGHKATYHDIATLDDLVVLCGDGETGEAIVLSNAMAQITTAIQALMRRVAIAGGDVQAAVDAYIPGVKAARSSVDHMSKATTAYSKMTKEEREAFITMLEQMEN